VTLNTLSKKDVTKLFLMAVIAMVIWGIIGLFLICLMQIVSMQNFAKDSVHKHGIAEMQASRLGGAAIIFGGICVLVFLAVGGLKGSGSGPLNIDWFAWIAILGCMALGLVEDIRNDSLSPRLRLSVTTLIFGVVLWFWPVLIPSSVGAPIIDELLSFPGLAFLLVLIFCVGFLNAINMADGANGLVSGIGVVANIIFYNEIGGLGFLVVLMSCSVFLIFNTISGRLFLGDAGAYGVGACILVSSLYFYAEGYSSLSFLAVLFCYPCIDFLFSITRRFLQGRSILHPDNDHLHNRIHFQYRKVFKSKNMANSASGLTVVSLSSGIALWGYLTDWLPVVSEQWSLVFLVQCLAYGLCYYLTGKSVLERQAA